MDFIPLLKVDVNVLPSFLLPDKTYSNGTISNNTWISNGIANESNQDLTMSYFYNNFNFGHYETSETKAFYVNIIYFDRLHKFYP